MKSANLKGLLYHKCQQRNRVPTNHFPWNLKSMPTPSTPWRRNSQQELVPVDVGGIWRSHIGTITHGLTLGRYGFPLQDKTAVLLVRNAGIPISDQGEGVLSTCTKCNYGNNSERWRCTNRVRAWNAKDLGTCRSGVRVTLAYFYWGVTALAWASPNISKKTVPQSPRELYFFFFIEEAISITWEAQSGGNVFNHFTSRVPYR